MISSQETGAKLFQVFCIGEFLINRNSCSDFVGYFYNTTLNKCIRTYMHTMQIDNNFISLIMYIHTQIHAHSQQPQHTYKQLNIKNRNGMNHVTSYRWQQTYNVTNRWQQTLVLLQCHIFAPLMPPTDRYQQPHPNKCITSKYGWYNQPCHHKPCCIDY